MNGFVPFFALLCILYRFGAALPVQPLADAALIAVYRSTGPMPVGALALTRSTRVQLKVATAGTPAAAFPNTGFTGVPLLAARCGPGAARPVLAFASSILLAWAVQCLSNA